MYEDYMQDFFGANFSPYENTYEQNMRNPQYYDVIDNYDYYTRNSMVADKVSELEDCYPEIYKIIYPMVRKACNQITKPLSRDLIDELTEDIYSHLEADNIINLNVNVDSNNSVNSQVNSRSSVSGQSVRKVQEPENRESRQRNSTLRDLVRILLLRELIGRPGNIRPPRPVPPPRPMPPRPPRPGYPGNIPPRPPMPPR